MWLQLHQNTLFFETLPYTNCQTSLCNSHFSQYLCQIVFSGKMRKEDNIVNLSRFMLDFSFCWEYVKNEVYLEGFITMLSKYWVMSYSIMLQLMAPSWIYSSSPVGHVGFGFLNARMFLTKEIFSIRGLWQRSSLVNCLSLSAKWAASLPQVLSPWHGIKAFNKWKKPQHRSVSM